MNTKPVLSVPQIPQDAPDDRWARPMSLRKRLYEIMEGGDHDDRASHIFHFAIVALILLNVAAFVAETVPHLRDGYARWFWAFEVFSVAVFTVEYVLRLWSCVEMPFLARKSAWQARAKFARRGPMIVDLIAIAPFYLSLLLPIDLRILRVLRLLRFLKLSRYSPAMHTLIRVLKNESRPLAGAGFLLIGAVLFASTGIYYLEAEAQPDKFGSVPESAWWAIATLTTVGYGDLAPITGLGKFFGSVVMVAGLCILSLPVAIISAGFAQEVGRRDFVINWSLMSRIPLFTELDAREVSEIMPLLNAHTLPANFEVIAAGSQGEAMYFVSSGRVHLRIDEEISVYGPGEFFGSVAMLEGGPNRGSFITVSRCKLLKLYRQDFAQLANKSPSIASHIREIAASRSSEAGDGGQ